MNGFGEITESIRRSTVQVEAGGRDAGQVGGQGGGSGSGVIWSADGVIVTNAHVARGARARFTLWDGSSLKGELIAKTLERDLAAFQTPGRRLAAATPGDSNSLRAGELVIAVGNPLGFIGAVTKGVVHGVGPVRGLGRQDWVQADVRLAPGNSGGPLADAHGRVIGINAMIAGGLALAVPSNAVSDFLKNGATDVELGVIIQVVPVVRENGASAGLVVLEVSEHSPAANASLAPGDVLIAVNGRSFASADDLRAALQKSGDGLIELQFLRGTTPAAGLPSLRRHGISADRGARLRKVTVQLPRHDAAPRTGVAADTGATVAA